MPHLLARVAGYIEYHQTHQAGFDDEPRIYPIEGTVMDDPMRDDRSEDNELVEYQSDDESDNEDPLKSLQHLTAYWKPRNGDLSILLPMYAQEITRLTGTDIFADEAEKRYRLFQGDFNLAREKLLRLEPLLETFKKQRPNESLESTGNLLVWPAQQKDAKMQFVHIVNGHPAYHRIIVNKSGQTLFRKVIGEIRLCTPSFEYEVPANLYHDGISPTTQLEASRVWDGFVFQSFGDPSNMEPIISSKPPSATNSDRHTVQDPDEERIAAWTNKVVSGADPDIAPEVPVEPAPPTRRRVLLDSDSEDDEPSDQVPQSQHVGLQATKAPSGLTMPRSASPEPSSDLVSLLSTPSRSVSKQAIENMASCGQMDEDLTTAQTAPPGLGMPLSAGREQQSDLLSLLSSPPRPTTGQVARSIWEGVPVKEAIGEASAKHDGTSVLDMFPGSLQTPLSSTGGANPQDRESFPDVFHISKPTLKDQNIETLSDEKRAKPQSNATDMQASASLVSATADLKLDKPLQSSTPAPLLSTPTTPPGPATAEATSPRPAFDPKAYGGPSPRLRRGHNVQPGYNPRFPVYSRGGRGQGNSLSRGQQLVPRGSSLQRGGNYRGSPASRGPAAGRGGLGGLTQTRQTDLVDTSAPSSNAAPRIPPGFESYVPLVPTQTPQRSQTQTPTTTPNIMDEPVRPAEPTHRAQGSESRSGTRTSGESRIRFSNEGADYQNTHVPKFNSSFLRESSLRAALEAVEARKKAQRQGSENKKAADDEKPAFHSTMLQQGKNPGRKPVKQETKAEAAARRAEALLDAHGPVPVKVPPKPQSSNASSESMSAWKKRQIRKNAPIADGHSDIVQDVARKQQCAKLIPQLEPLFETCRAFNGRVSFELSFGQVLIVPGTRISDQQYHNVNDWDALFGPKPTVSPCPSTFTKILTTNGADVDRALELKGPTADVNVKLWTTNPAEQSVSYEFSCQSRSNEDFLILVDESGKHELRKGLVTVGMINMHVPAQIWDASAIISGHLKWFEPPDTLKKSAATFVNSLYVVPAREKLMIVFRQPNDHEVQVRNLIVKRVSYHACNLPGYEDIQLKVVESKSLLFKVHPSDKKLWQGYEGTKEEYEKLSTAGRIHYEMSLVHTGINQVLAQNEDLEIGELTPTETTGRSLVDRAVISSMLDIAVHMLSKIDFIGMQNVGTQARRDAEEEQRRRQLQESLGPKGKSILQAPTRIGVASVSRFHPGSLVNNHLSTGAGGGTGGGGSSTHIAPTVKPPVHGVRMNTIAEVFEDSDGRYMLGMGGARIPVAGEPQPSSSTVMPDDSASQVGGRPPAFYTTWSTDSHRGDGFW
ncbi:hypothetical protein A1O3_09455 [Capronia epimyces CBS 606.96]|uniref:Uncharacterized protein n=1 Tax=Capronia epimyces CBS 606.96 TaxID=1182542 RepID=W9Y7A8_9EURO|nr:uncharacterized protein A1O3_09455 [Capronia epimyces CBS 606.96]EXJ78294.1 hypothetical protein A1O3_09455 [Capronia epimyces CBS 606.96]